MIVGLGVLIFYLKQNKKYDWVPVKRGSVQEAIYGLGTVKSKMIFEHRLGTTNRIRKLYVREGDSVKKGTRLLDLSEGSPVLAPFAGTVTSLPFHENENIFPQTNILRLEDLQDRYVEVTLEQQGAIRVRPGQKVRLSFESLRQTLLFGEVESIYPWQGQFLVRIPVEKLNAEILPGMTADVAIEVGQVTDALLVPMIALFNNQVTVKRNQKSQKQFIKLGRSDGEFAEVLDDSLKEGDMVRIPRKAKP